MGAHKHNSPGTESSTLSTRNSTLTNEESPGDIELSAQPSTVNQHQTVGAHSPNVENELSASCEVVEIELSTIGDHSQEISISVAPKAERPAEEATMSLSAVDHFRLQVYSPKEKENEDEASSSEAAGPASNRSKDAEHNPPKQRESQIEERKRSRSFNAGEAPGPASAQLRDWYRRNRSPSLVDHPPRTAFRSHMREMQRSKFQHQSTDSVRSIGSQGSSSESRAPSFATELASPSNATRGDPTANLLKHDSMISRQTDSADRTQCFGFALSMTKKEWNHSYRADKARLRKYMESLVGKDGSPLLNPVNASFSRPCTRKRFQELTEQFLACAYEVCNNQNDGVGSKSQRRCEDATKGILDNRWFDSFERRQCIRPHDSLDKELALRLKAKPDKTRLAWGCSEWSFKKMSLHLVVLLAVSMLLLWAIVPIQKFADESAKYQKYVRILCRDQSAQLNGSQIMEGIIFLRHRCSVNASTVSTTVDGSSHGESYVIYNFSDHNGVDGFKWRQGTSKIRNTVKLQGLVESKWATLGSDSWRIGLDGNVQSLQREIPSDEVVTFGPIWPWVMAYPATYAVAALLVVGCHFSSSFQLGYWTVPSCVLLCCMQLLSASCFVYYGKASESFMCWMRSLMAAGASLRLHRNMRSTYSHIQMLLEYCCLHALVTIVERVAVFDDLNSLIGTGEVVAECMLCLTVLLAILLRYWTLPRQLERFATDDNAMSRLWREHTSNQQFQGALQELHEYLDNSFGDKVHPVYHSYLSPLDVRCPIPSVDQLFMMAAAVHPLFAERVETWAVACNGFLQVSRRSTSKSDESEQDNPIMRSPSSRRSFFSLLNFQSGIFQSSAASVSNAGMEDKLPRIKLVAAEDIQTDRNKGLACEVHLPVKKFERTLDKICTLYRGNVSACCDVVRGVITFNDIEDLSRCLREVSRDASVRIIRIKDSTRSRLNPLKHIKVNLQFIHPTAKLLGVDGFVCELILVMKDIWGHRDHERYYEWRVVMQEVEDLESRLQLPKSMHRVLKMLKLKAQDSMPLPSSPKCRQRASTTIPIASDVNKDRIQLFRESVREPARSRDKRIGADVAGGVSTASLHGVFLTAKPMNAAFTKIEYRFMVILAISWWLASFFVTAFGLTLWGFEIRSVLNDGRMQGREFRFLVEDTRGGQAGRVGDFGLTLDKCLISCEEGCSLNISSNPVHLVFEQKQTFNGWYFATTRDEPARDPVIFSVEMKEEGGQWLRIGSSGTFQVHLSHLVHPLSRYQTPLERDALVEFHLGERVPFLVLWVYEPLAPALASMFLFILLCNKVETWTLTIVCVLTYTWGTITIVLAPLFENFLVSLEAGLRGSSLIVATYLLHKYERYAPDLAFLEFALVFLMRLAFQLPSNVDMIFIHIPWAAWAAMGLIAKGMQMYSRQSIRRLWKSDEKQNKEIWEAVLARPGEVEQLRLVQSAVELITPLSEFPMCQRGVQWRGRMETNGHLECRFWERVALGTPGLYDTRVGLPQESLSQIFYQAQILKPLLEEKVRRLALECNGMLAVLNSDDGTTFLPAVEALAPDCTARIKYAPLKKTERVKQKLHRCYRGDISRLCDLCRESIVFEKASDLLTCLQLITCDPHIVVTRTKSSMDPDGEPQHLSGFRQISVNFTLQSPQACMKGVSWHVAELQLLLLEFARIKSEDGHRRYVVLRDGRGE